LDELRQGQLLGSMFEEAHLDATALLNAPQVYQPPALTNAVRSGAAPDPYARIAARCSNGSLELDLVELQASRLQVSPIGAEACSVGLAQFRVLG